NLSHQPEGRDRLPLGRLKGWWNTAAFELAFLRREISAARVNLEEANRRFDTTEAVAAIKQCEAEIAHAVDKRFSASLNAAATKVDEAQRQLARAISIEKLLKRSFEAELEPLYQQHRNLKEQLNEAHEEKSDAWDRLNSAKSSLDHWHARSKRNFMGNKDRELPRYSLFGQNLSDRDHYKDQRDSAWRDIEEAKDEIEAIKAKLAQLNAEIATVKSDRALMKQHRSDGLNAKLATENSAAARERLDSAKVPLQRLGKEKEDFRRELELEKRLSELRAKPDALRWNRAAFLETFRSPEQRAIRKSAFAAERERVSSPDRI
ncbi:hypothetical protein KYN89_15255, partial [Alteriqipengyuania sp. NZ-12B]